MTFIRVAVATSVFPLAGAALCLVPAGAGAAGFALNEMSAASVGNAHAGGAAAAEDSSTIYYNPAGLMRLQGQQFVVAGSAIRASAKFENRGSTSAVGSPMTGGNGGDAGGWSVVPALFYATPLGPDMRAGIGLHAPFGLKTNYDQGWAGRYQALKSDLKTININPSLAYKLNDQVSVGAGISAQYVDVKLTRAIDFGSVCVGSLGPAACAPIGFVPQARDGNVRLDGSDWGFGFNFGVLIEPVKNTRLGFAYRSKTKHKLSGGEANFSTPAGLPAPIAQSPAFRNTGASADLVLPESISASALTNLDDKWSVMADATWTRWSRFKELRVRFDSGAPDSVVPQNWRDTVRVSAAVNYRYNDAWKLRAGLGYDQTPVRGAFRTARIPDSNRTMLAFGAQFASSRDDAWEFGYFHLFLKDAPINHAEPPVGGTLVGNYENNANVLSVQYSHKF